MAHHMHAQSMNLGGVDPQSGLHHAHQHLDPQGHQANQYLQRNLVNQQLVVNSQGIQHAGYDPSTAKQLASMVSLSSPMSCMASPPNSVQAVTSQRHVSAAVAALINGNGQSQSVITSVSSNRNSNSDLGLHSPDRSLGSPCSGGYDYTTNSLVGVTSPPTSPVRSVINLHSPSNLMSSSLNGSVLDSITTTMAGNQQQQQRTSSNESDNNSPIQQRLMQCSPSPPPLHGGQLTSLTVSHD